MQTNESTVSEQGFAQVTDDKSDRAAAADTPKLESGSPSADQATAASVTFDEADTKIPSTLREMSDALTFQSKNQDEAIAHPDIEHIVSSGVARDETTSTETLRELVARAREQTGQAREHLPPGFSSDPVDSESFVTAEEAEVFGEKRSQPVPNDDAKTQTNTIPKHTEGIAGEDSEDRRPKSADTDSEDSDSGSDGSELSSSASSDDEDSITEDRVSHTTSPKALVGDYDDDEDGGQGGTSSAPATKNEVIAPEVDMPSIQQLDEADRTAIKPLGRVHSIVDSVVVIEQDVTRIPEERQAASGTLPIDSTGRRGEDEGEYSVVDTGSLLCFQDGKVLGFVFETFGSIHSPMYSVRFASASVIDKEVVQTGKAVFYLPAQSTYVMTRHLRLLKGSDASNIYDEEVGDDEVDYSDDEAEAEAKRRAKATRSGKTDESGNPVPSTNSRAKKRHKQNNAAAQSQPQRSISNQSQSSPVQRNGGNAGPSNRASLLVKPMKGLPTRPVFDHDGGVSSANHRQVLSYGEPDAGGVSQAGHHRLPNAPISSLPAKPISNVPTISQGRQPSVATTPPAQANGASSISAAPVSYQMPAASYITNTVAQGWYGSGSSASATPPSQAAYGVQHDRNSQAGHYNPQFAAYWQQQPQAAWYGAQHYQQQYNYPASQYQHYPTVSTQAQNVQRPPYANAQSQWGEYHAPPTYHSYNTGQSTYSEAPTTSNAPYPQQQTQHTGYPAGHVAPAYGAYGYGPAGPKPPTPGNYDPHNANTSNTQPH